MTSHVEMYFLYGEAYDETAPVTRAEAWLRQFAYADLTTGAALSFAVVTLLGFMALFWEDLAPWISAVAKRLVSPILAVVAAAGSLVMQLVCVRSRQKLGTIIQDRVKQPVVACRLVRLVSAVVGWWFPSNQPLTTVCRLAGSFVCGVTAYVWLFFPLSQFLSGFADGLLTETKELSLYCMGIHGQWTVASRLTWRQWGRVAFCNGEETGLELRAIIEDDWQLPRLFDLDGEIHHLRILALVVASVSLVIMAVWSFRALSETALFQRVVVVFQQPPSMGQRADHVAGSDTQLPGSSINKRQDDLIMDLISRYEGILSEKERLLSATTQKLRATEQRMEDGWAQVKRLTALQVKRAEEPRARESTDFAQLRRKLAETEARLSLAQGRARAVEDDATARVRSLCDKVAELEQQLQAQREQAGDISLGEVNSLRAELQVRNDQPVDIEHRLAAAEARELDSRGRANDTDAERRQLADRVHELDAQVQEHTAKNEVLQALCDTLSQECGSLAAIQQERDDAFGLASALQHELVSTRATADNAFRESQESLAQTRAAESTLRQSMQELRHACDLTLAQERAASARAQARASELEAEVEDLQTKVVLAMRDAQRAQERAVSAERTIGVLQTRLTRYEDAKRGALQEIPKRHIGHLGSISTALAESEVKVAQQQTEINDLRRQVEQLKLQGSSGPTDKAVQEDVQKLRAALDRVRRERTDDQLRWDKRTRELEEDNRKLRISLSNAEAASARRCGGRRPPTLP
ncbi:hypothetical protein CNMCM5793_004583 [Aspergillus hiratsukae]|uniref:Integral membrane protein n=1 Tax=Aspergillus hiratsukae TaxID=1194566 RepID=A0A8H6UG42_9EURO|nr:hypothetical protein CNMCM5793_004583 [Aspergillus hiratsukae]KAF7169978.1 hypothetical protein CNMCM6106_004817 [Aspergillus hiratsukae]